MDTIERLKVLKKVINNLPEERFDMGTFVSLKKCGTVCCALGALAISPEGEEMGLSLNVRVIEEPNSLRIIHRDENGKITEGYDAGAAVLGITFEIAHDLFSPLAYGEDKIPKSSVIKKIDKLIKKLERKK